MINEGDLQRIYSWLKPRLTSLFVRRDGYATPITSSDWDFSQSIVIYEDEVVCYEDEVVWYYD